MTTIQLALTDSATMFRRQLKHALRYPNLTLSIALMPIIFLLLFVYVFGGTLGDGLGGGSGGRTAYANYLAPGIMLMTVAGVVSGTAISVAMDMTGGIIARFRTMAVARVSVLTGHVLSSLVQALVAVALVFGVALLVGFRPNATPVEWLATVGVFAVIGFALIWLAVAMGLVSKTVEGASNLPLPLVLLPFLGSGFVPTDSMPAWLRGFAEYQPFTAFIETVRGLLTGTGIGNHAILTVAWSAGIALVGYLWAKKLFNRDPSR
jgi:ABC-2 type transport system permease protein